MKRKRPESLTLEAEAWRGEFTHAPQNRQPEYRLTFHLTNPTARELKFDEMSVFVAPQCGRVLRIDQKAAGNEADEGIFTLGEGQEWTGTLTTNGYTGELLADAHGSPLQLEIRLSRGPHRVDGPFFGLLPSLDSLPADSDDPFFSPESKPAGRRIYLGRTASN